MSLDDARCRQGSLGQSGRQASDPTKDLKFQRVVQHFLKTPHKPHKPTGIGRKKKPPAKKKT